MKIEKFKSKKIKDEEVTGFKASSLEPEKQEVQGLGIKSEPVEHDEKELSKLKKNKIEKFESFVTININNVENFEIEGEIETEESDDEEDFDAEYEEEEGCGCCNDCTGQPGCDCGCKDCECVPEPEEPDMMKATEFVKGEFSENLKFHLQNNKPITENVFRPDSEAFYSVIKETRNLYDLKRINLCEIDNEIFESTEIGKFAYFKGKLVALDIPMENIEEIKEAEYKGKEVKLNYPMRGGTKKYYVYVKNPKTGKVKKISFGDVHGGLTAKVSNPEARKSFAARHKCSTKKDKTKAGYWACRINKYGHLWGGKTYPGYW